LGSGIYTSLNKKFEDFRTKSVSNFKVADVHNIKIVKHTTKEVLTLKKIDGAWNLVSPKTLPADGNNVALLLDKYSRAKAEKVTEKSALNPSLLSSYSLNPSTQSVQLLDQDGKPVQSFELGLTKEAIYITMADGAVGSLPINVWTDFAPEVKGLRDRKVMKDVVFADINRIKTKSGRTYQKEGNDWYPVSTPEKPLAEASKDAQENKLADSDANTFFIDWQYMLADDIIDPPESKKLSTYGLDNPVSTFSFAFKEDAKKPAEEVIVGNRVPKDEKKIYVKRASQPEVYIVDTKWMDRLAKLDGLMITADKDQPEKKQ